jgi:thiopeptide-type bacteriocin biosynthesis protein
MSADHLTATPTQLAAGVQAVLAGADLNTAASDCGLEAVQLAEAVQTYHAAGLAALEQRAEHAWYQINVEFSDWSAAETVGATQLGARLAHLEERGELGTWWFLRKHPCWRLRLRHPDVAAVNRQLDELTTTGGIARWWRTTYEPETAAFGGTDGMDTIHDLFCADSCGVLAYLRHEHPGIGRRELSILLISGLFQAAGLDTFERGDVFARVAQLRPTPTDTNATRIEQLAENVRVLLSVPDLPTSGLFSPGEPAAHAGSWLAAFQTAGHQVGTAAARGELKRGLRAILTHVLIFHWNRFGLSATGQSVLARAATMALLPEVGTPGV